MTKEIRTRFAPSPTGSLHLGNVRVAAFNWLFARRHGGTFILRIEDTDLTRGRRGSEESIRDDLRWLGLDWDEGPDRVGPSGPYRQSEGGRLYREAADRLVGRGRAYPCFCGPGEGESEPVDHRARERGVEIFRYSGRCRDLEPKERQARLDLNQPFVIRFVVPPERVLQFQDEIRGTISFPSSDFSDFVLLRGDGRPTYNFAVVVDDIRMRISHVIRGAGHLSNTPKQLLLFEALEGALPKFIHLPTVLSPKGGKLSKRGDAAAVGELRERGFHPDGVLNYISLLGWSSPSGREVLTRRELIAQVSLERLRASDTVYDPEKLRWISAQHVARMDLDALLGKVLPFLDRARYPLEGRRLGVAVEAVRTHLSVFGDINRALGPFFPASTPELARVRERLRVEEATGPLLRTIRTCLQALPEWEEAAIREAVRESGKECMARGARLFHPLREALTGSPAGPDVAKLLFALGRKEVVFRLGHTLGVRRGGPRGAERAPSSSRRESPRRE